MAAAILSDLATKGSARRIHIDSAGTDATDGDPASIYALRVMAGRGLHLDGRRAKKVTEGLIHEADLVLTMTRHHVGRLRSIYPRSEAKIFALGDYAGTNEDIADPFISGGTLAAYEEYAAQLEPILQRVLARMQEK
jgi:protein-tyrosine-phosphatase